MDAYNRGYDAGINLGAGSDATGIQVGDATIFRTRGDAAAVAEGFYGIAYDLGGETIVSFRGTDAGGDVNDWGGGLGWQTGQAALAAEFYQDVAQLKGANLYSGNISFTGHSLGGGLAGLLGALYDQDAIIFDNMAFEAASASVHHHATNPTVQDEFGNTVPNPFH